MESQQQAILLTPTCVTNTVTWSGWYRLFTNDVSAHIPDTCVATYSCGNYIPLWIGVDTQELRMESSLEMSAVTGAVTAAITVLPPLKSKHVRAIIMSMSWLVQMSAIQHTVQVIILHMSSF